ncbi:MAG: pyruvate kinase [Candidatus Woesearchaeota archaeon]|nr:pyruvate kinase [Candidatus Woesearchaeota archaeon]
MFFKKKTKIIATVGPSSEREDILEKMILAGVDCIRLNFSHNDHKSHGKIIKSIRKIEKKLVKHIAIIADIQGPKIRVGILPKEGLVLNDGQKILLDSSTKYFVNNTIPIPSKTFMDSTSEGNVVFFDDGTIKIKITNKNKSIFSAVVIKGGVLFSNKGINVPSLYIKGSVLSQKDKSDIIFAVKSGVDYVAISFLRDANDVKEARKFLKNTEVKIIAKIERPEALLNIDQIIDEADAIMIARGDLGIETPLWELPVRQKEIVERVRNKMKPVIVATQMLDSMIRNPIPTRAEVSDVANAVYDSADAVMLSGETASGKNPLEAVEMMRKVLESTEIIQNYTENSNNYGSSRFLSISKSAADIASEVNAKAIFVKTISGESARTISFFRPKNNIVAITTNPKIACQLSLVRGVIPFVTKKKSAKNIKDLILSIDLVKNFLKNGDVIVCVYDVNFNFSKETNINTITIESI